MRSIKMYVFLSSNIIFSQKIFIFVVRLVNYLKQHEFRTGVHKADNS